MVYALVSKISTAWSILVLRYIDYPYNIETLWNTTVHVKIACTWARICLGKENRLTSIISNISIDRIELHNSSIDFFIF